MTPNARLKKLITRLNEIDGYLNEYNPVLVNTVGGEIWGKKSPRQNRRSRRTTNCVTGGKKFKEDHKMSTQNQKKDWCNYSDRPRSFVKVCGTCVTKSCRNSDCENYGQKATKAELDSVVIIDDTNPDAPHPCDFCPLDDGCVVKYSELVVGVYNGTPDGDATRYSVKVISPAPVSTEGGK